MHRFKLKKRSVPGALLYFGGAVHEVLDDGHSTRERSDLTSNSPRHLWKPKFAKTIGRFWRRAGNFDPAAPKRSQIRRWLAQGRNPDDGSPRRRGRLSGGKWIQRALRHHRRGQLHRDMGLPLDQKIPPRALDAHIRRLRVKLAGASGVKRDRIRVKLRRAYLGRQLKQRTAARATFREMSLRDGRKIRALLVRRGNKLEQVIIAV